MAAREQIPEATIQRLPMYLRCLLEAQRVGHIGTSSQDLAQACGTNAAQVRKDLSYFGEVGTRGVGYDVQGLIAHLSSILGVIDRRRTAIIGVGSFGHALADYTGFSERGFEVVAAIDADPEKIGTTVAGVIVTPVDDLEATLTETEAEIVIIATPAHVAQAIADRAVSVGIKAILNLAPMRLTVPDDVVVRQVCLSADLQVLSFHLAHNAL